jgi:SAM-dependent methyltransferase
MVDAVSSRTQAALELFAPLGPTYDRYARLLSLGQDPRWRAFLVDRVEVGPDDTVVDVAAGTGAVSLELARRKGCSVVAVDQSAEMLEIARRRIMLAAATRQIRLVEGRAEALPFEDGTFDALTVTYLLRYVDDPGATLVWCAAAACSRRSSSASRRRCRLGRCGSSIPVSASQQRAGSSAPAGARSAISCAAASRVSTRGTRSTASSRSGARPVSRTSASAG